MIVSFYSKKLNKKTKQFVLFKAGAQDTFNVLRTQLENNVVGK